MCRKVHQDNPGHLPGMQDRCMQCGWGERRFLGRRWIMILNSTILFLLLVVVETEDVRKVMTESNMLGDDFVMVVDENTYMAEYSYAWMRAL